MNLYGQDEEFRLLARVLPHLTNRSVVDVGAERGSFTMAMLRAGAAEVHSIEPEPRNVEFLRERFRNDPRVTVHDIAISGTDGDADLYVATDRLGGTVPVAHSLTKHADSERVVWHDSIRVTARSLGSLVAGGELPSRIGILKVDTEGHDLDVVAALGELDFDVVMTEHRVDLPHADRRCPWTIDQMLECLSPRGFHQFAFYVHRGQATIVQWNDACILEGFAGALVFFHDRVVRDLATYVLASASTLARNVSELAERRLETLHEIDYERELQTTAVEKRLREIELLEGERARQTEIAAERLREIVLLDRERTVQSEIAAERLREIELLDRERALQTKVAAERLRAVEELARAHDAVKAQADNSAAED